MAGTVITVSPRVHINDLERLVRARIARHGGAMIVAATRDQRQVRQLRRLAHRMAAIREEGGACFFLGPQAGGGTWLAVVAGNRPVGSGDWFTGMEKIS